MRVGTRTVAYALLLLAFLSWPAAAEDERELLRSLKLQSGNITLPGGIATMAVGTNFAYLDSKDSETFLTKLWGNPPGTGADTLGMLLPKDADALGANAWAVVIDYDPSGYVSDNDATTIDYDQLLKTMQEATDDANEERVKNGYKRVTLVGWAKPPAYDPVAHKLYWAKRLRFEGSKTDTLNYNIRVLGRRGVLTLIAVADIDQLPLIDRRTPEILGMVSFNQGNTYAEFDPSIDKAAAYGIAGLIAGGLLAKAGFFKALLIALLAFKKAVAVGVLAFFGVVVSALKRLFRRTPPPPAT
jgi:uncharacterized membrane-anchored protein